MNLLGKGRCGKGDKGGLILFLSIFNSCKDLVGKDNQTVYQSVGVLNILVGCLELRMHFCSRNH